MALACRYILDRIETLVGQIPGSRRYGFPLLFAVFAAPVFIIVAFLVVRAEQDAATDVLIQSVEIQNANLARTMANTHFDPISYLLAFDIGDAPELLPIAIRRSGLDAIVRDSLDGTNIVNMKIYDDEGITLFSLNEEDLGVNISSCVCFAHALSGHMVSELVRTNDAHHNGISTTLDGDHGDHGDHGGIAPDQTGMNVHASADVDVLSTMIQISVLAPDIIASDSVLEIQSEVTSLLAAIDDARLDVFKTVGIPLFALYVIMVLIVFCFRLWGLRRENEALELASQVAQFEASNLAKSEFLSLMSHELRTPLNAIIGFSELIEQNERDNEDSETGNYARTIHESGHHMLRQIVSILDMTAIELGELDLDGVPVALDEIARDAVANVQSSFDRGLVTLDVHEETQLPLVHGDPTKLRQVIENLLSNAARFTPAGGTVELVFGTEPGGWVCLGIKDTGVGMTREQIERARLPFEQNWNGMSREADGAGLGLTIADKVVTQLGGELVIESLKDVGTTIVVRLPEIANEAVSDDHRNAPTMMAAE